MRAAISGVLREGAIAAALTALMILLFLGSWRSTFIIALSIPLSVLCSIATLSALGETINLMTLGGLALAVGILVDDATVAIENIHRHMALGKKLEDAIIVGSQEIALPAFVSTLCICIVFVPMFFLTGVARYLFVPLAEAVVFAMLASYVLSRTLVPTLVMWFYRNVKLHGEHIDEASVPFWLRPFVSFQRAFENGFDRLRNSYRALLASCFEHRKPVRHFLSDFLRGVVAADAGARPGFFPDRGRRTVHAAHARPHRHAHRGNRAARGPGQRIHPQGNSRARTRRHPRQHRHSEFLDQFELQHQRRDRAGATRTFSFRSSPAMRRRKITCARCANG